MKKTILIHPSNYNLRINEYLSLASILKDDYNIIFSIFNNSSDIQKTIQILENNNFKYITSKVDIHKKSYLIKVYEKITKYFAIDHFLLSKDTTFGQIYHYNIFLRKYKNAIDAVQKMLYTTDIDFIMTKRDNGWSAVETALLTLADTKKVKVVLPYFMYHSHEGTYLTIKDNLKYKDTDKANIYQRYIFNKHKNLSYKSYHYYPAFLLAVLDKLNLLSSVPWRFGFNDKIEKVFVANKSIYDEYISLGINRKKISIVGDVSYIELYKSYTNKKVIAKNIIKKYNLQNKPFIIVSLPNFAHHKLISKDTEQQYIYNLSEVLSNITGYNILISLKPAMVKEDYLYLEQNYGLTIVDEKLMSVMPIADLFIVTYSSTILWSVLYGIKTIMLEYMVEIDKYYTNYTSVSHLYQEKDLLEDIYKILDKDIDFSHDWDILSKDIVFHKNIKDNYLNTLKDM